MAARVAIAGGGLGGLGCAKSLVDTGHQVLLFEGLPFLGGRASTFRDGDGDWVEQGLHLFLGTYSEFKKLLSEIGQSPDDVLFWMDELRLQDPHGPEAVYGISPLRAPLKTILSTLGQNDFLARSTSSHCFPFRFRGLEDSKPCRRSSTAGRLRSGGRSERERRRSWSACYGRSAGRSSSPMPRTSRPSIFWDGFTTACTTCRTRWPAATGGRARN